MEIIVNTGKTKETATARLLHKHLRSKNQEQIVILLQTDAEEESTQKLHQETIDIVSQSLVLTEGDTAQRLDSCLKEINGLIKGFLLSRNILDFQAIIAIVDLNNVLHVSHAGRAEAYVVRSGAANQITEYSKGKTIPSFVHIASGQLDSGDFVILSTQRLLRTVTPAQLVKTTVNGVNTIKELIQALEFEHESSALAVIIAEHKNVLPSISPETRTVHSESMILEDNVTQDVQHSSVLESAWKNVYNRIQKTSLAVSKNNKSPFNSIARWFRSTFILKKTDGMNVHLLLLAGVIGIFLVIWLGVNVGSFAKKSQLKSELSAIIDQVNEDIRNAENRKLTGDKQSAIAILDRAEEQAKKVANDDSQLFRKEALDLIDNIQSKREDVSNIIRRSPTVAANLAEKNPAIQSIGMIALNKDNFIVYDKQKAYRVLSNTIEDPKSISDEELIISGTNFPRYKSQVFSVTGNGMIEYLDNKPVSMKTDDTKGWIANVDMEAYQRFLYLLSPTNNQIYKYERLNDRYGSPLEYNVDGKLDDALDMSIDVYVYVLKKDGTIIKLLSGESKPFTINQAPADILKNATKLYKVPDGKLYVLDPTDKKVIVLEIDATTGDATYLRQFKIDGDQIGTLHSLYIDDEESWLYIADEKRVLKVELSAQR